MSTTNVDSNKKCYCWNGCDDILKTCIERNQFVKQVRTDLVKKKNKDKFKR